MDEFQKDNVPEPGIQFPNWLEEILPVNMAKGYLRRRCPLGVHDDILNEVAKKLFPHYNSGKHLNRAYVFSAVRSCVIDYHRKVTKEPNTIQINEQTRTAKHSKRNNELKEFSDQIDEVLSQLKSLDLRARVLIKLRLHHSYRFTYKDLGDILGYSEATVRQEYKKYINIIRYKLEQDNCQDEKSA